MLNKAGQAQAQKRADEILRYAPSPQIALEAAHREYMWALDNSRKRRDWAIAAETDRIVALKIP